MPYIQKNTLISRKGYSGLSGWLDSVGDVLKGALTSYGDQQKAAGALAVQVQQPVYVPAPSSGIPTTALVVGGIAVAGLAIVLLNKRKK